MHTLPPFTFVGAAHTDPIRVFDLDYVIWQAVITAADIPETTAVVTAEAGWDPDTDTITKSGIVLLNGTPVQVTTATTLPTGVTALTDYYVGNVDKIAGTFQLFESYEDAIGGDPDDAVDFSDNGTGNHTVTPVELVTPGPMAKRQGSVDGVYFEDIEDSERAIVSGTYLFRSTNIDYPYERLAFEDVGSPISVAITYETRGA